MTTTRRKRRVMAALVTVALAAGCTPAGTGATTVPTQQTTLAPGTTGPPSDALPVCLAGDIGFGTTGLVGTPGENGGDAGRLSAVTWATMDGCERIELQFVTTDGAPASLLGAASAELRADAGIVRLTLPPQITTSSVSDGRADGDLIERFFVVRDPNGALFIDFHLTADAATTGVEARAFDVDAPARAIIDLRPGGTAVTVAPDVTDSLVLLLPRNGPVALPFLVRGYARDLSGGVEASLVAAGTEVSSAAAEGTALDDAWRSFEVVIAAGTPGSSRLIVTVAGISIGVDLDITG